MYNYDFLFHNEVFMPNKFMLEAKVHQINKIDSLINSGHIYERMIEKDKKHDYNESQVKECLLKLKNNPVAPFEVGIINGKLVKYVIRVPFDSQRDIAIAIGNSSNKVITAWVNYKSDNHYTLNKSRYNNERQWNEWRLGI